MDRSSTYLDIFLTEIHKGTMKSEKNLKVNHTCKKRHHITSLRPLSYATYIKSDSAKFHVFACMHECI